MADTVRPLKNVQFWSRSRKAKISTTGIYRIFRGLKFEPDAEIGQISADFERGRFSKVSGTKEGLNVREVFPVCARPA